MRLSNSQRKQYKENVFQRWQENGRCCQVCGRPIPEIKYINAAHIESRNGNSVENILTRFIVCCENLHIYSHTAAKNLESDSCIRFFKINYWNGHRKFWDRFCRIKKIFDYSEE